MRSIRESSIVDVGRSVAPSQDDKPAAEQDQDEARPGDERSKDHVAATASRAAIKRGVAKQQHDGKSKDQRRKSPSGKNRSGGRRTSVHNSSPLPGVGTPLPEVEERSVGVVCLC
jgi:hypothetical protein